MPEAERRALLEHPTVEGIQTSDERERRLALVRQQHHVRNELPLSHESAHPWRNLAHAWCKCTGSPCLE